jgi:hypothetical protein
VITKPLPSNTCSFLQLLHSNGTTRNITPSFRLFVPNGLQAYHHFFSEGRACNVCASFHLPFCGSISHGVYSPSASAAPSLRLLVLSGSLIGCQSVQVYHHHLPLVGAAKVPRVVNAPAFMAPTLCAISSFVSEGVYLSTMSSLSFSAV